MKAVIQAGGKGTRLTGYREKDLPKSMLKIGDKSILEHQAELLKKYGITDIIIIVNHLKEKIIDYFGDGKKFGSSISYHEEKEPLGTVGGIKEIEHLLTEDFIVFYGDVMINMDLSRFISFHNTKKSICTLVLHPNDHPYDSDLVELDKGNRITVVHPKPHEQGKYYKNLVNAGAYIFSPSFLKYLEKGKKADFGKDIFPKLYKDIPIYGYNTFEYLKDMGTPERIEQVNSDYTSGKISQMNYENKQKAIFLDRDGVTTVEKDLVYNHENLELYSFTPKAIREINNSTYLSVIVTNQSVIARNLCTVEELEYIHKKMETKLGNRHAKLDAIYYCPHHPDKGYPEERKEYKIDCECRKPKPGMLLEAAKDLNIDLQESWLIGDAERDVIAGKRAGCATVGVMTGFGVKKTSERPEFFFPDVLEAAMFIINEPYKDLFNKIHATFLKSKAGKPYVISIAGNAKSGKSNLAAYISRRFNACGLKTMKIELDNWILPEDQRQHCKNVYDRFRINKLIQDIQDVFKGKAVSLLSYPNHPERKAQPIEYKLNNENIVIIDGIIALSREELREVSDLKVFMEIDEKTLRKRILDYYFWRGKKESDIVQLLKKRQKDEYQLIEKECKFADFIINSIFE
jgi:D,D-heptose 1,7-bisphosphate phosphatase